MFSSSTLKTQPWRRGCTQAGFRLAIACLGMTLAHGANVTWTNGGLDNVWNSTTNWSGASSPTFLPVTGDRIYIDKAAANRAAYGTGASPNYNDLYLGSGSGKTGLLEITGGSLKATNNASRASYIGASGGNGTVIQSEGAVELNALVIGNGSASQGSYSISGGSLVIARGGTNGSLDIGNGTGTGQGTFEISGGSLMTRSGVTLGDGNGTAIFNVAGSGAAFIDIGSSSSIDGYWSQSASGTLKVGIDLVGVTPIFIDYVDGTGNLGDVTFANGAKLDVGFLGGSDRDGTWDVMKWEGTLINNGLQFAPTVNQSIWSMAWVDTDGLNGPDTLRVTATGLGTPTGRTSVTVSSISQLRQFSAIDNCDVTMTPGVYQMHGPATRPATSQDEATFINLRGLDSTYDFTGVTINVDTQELAGYGSTYGPIMLAIASDGIQASGLTLTMQKTAYDGVDAWGDPKEFVGYATSLLAKITGSNTTLKDCTITTGGSYPYGYGDAFGKGARPNVNGVTSAAFISHKKQSGCLVTNGATHVTLDNVDLIMRSYGHGFFCQQGASNIHFKDCDVTGDEMTNSNVMIAHPVYQQWGAATYGQPIPPDILISKHEDAFRTYGNSDFANNGYPELCSNITIENCTATRMRGGVAMADMGGYLRINGSTMNECELGYMTATSPATENTFTGCAGDARVGPLLVFYRSSNNANVEMDLKGTQVPVGSWPIALIGGDNNHVTFTRSAAPGIYPPDAYVNVSQKWREWRHRAAGDIDEVSTTSFSDYSTGNTILNGSGQPLVFGPGATGNSGCVSGGGVINKGSNNTYTGTTLVPEPIVIQDTWTYPPNPIDPIWAHYSGSTLLSPTAPYTVFSGIQLLEDSNSLGGVGIDAGTIVSSGGTLEVASGFNLQNGEDVVVSGNGTTGQGAIFTSGSTSNTTRLNSSTGSIILAGNATIGVGTAGNQFLIGPVSGNGSLTKTGPGKLAMERFESNTFTGSLTVAEGEINARTGKATNDLIIAAGAIFSQNGSLALNQDPDESTVVDGTLNINSRGISDTAQLVANIGMLSGNSNGIVTATSTAAVQILNVTGSTTDGTYAGEIQGRVSLVKSGTSKLTLTSTSHSHSEPTVIDGGTLAVSGSLPSSSPVAVNDGGILAGTGTINGAITLANGSAISPGNSVGTLTTSHEIWMGGAALHVEMSDAAGSAGSGWDLLVIDGTLTLDSSITTGVPFNIHLSGDAANFSNSQNQSWLIASFSGIADTFDPSSFVVDSSAFTHPLNGGQFSISMTGNELHLDFTAATYTALELWRITYFSSHSNTGIGADGYDADFDGHVNLLEYATGTNPILPQETPIQTLVKTVDGTRLTLEFNRIADPSLTYTVQGSHDLDSEHWIPVWSSTGAANTAGPVIVPDSELVADHLLRFLRLQVSY